MNMKKYFPLIGVSVLLTLNVISQDYFPLVQGSYWVYDVYQDGSLSYQDSVAYNESRTLNDTAFYLFVHHYIENDTISMTDTFYLYDNFEDQQTVMLSNRNQPVIDSAVYGKHSYTDGEWWIAKKIPENDTINVSNIGQVTVSDGTFSDCFMQGDEYIFAPDIGIIKIKLWNDESYYDLVRYYIPSQTSVKSIIHKPIEVYPNPARNFINVTGVVNTNYQILTVSGKLIQAGFLESSRIDISALRRGNYILKIQIADGFFSTQIIKD